MSRVRARVLLVAIPLLSLAFAGCIELPTPDAPEDRERATTASGPVTMTGEEERKDSTAPCVQAGVGFCAERRITVTGDISGISLLDVSLATVNGAVRVTGGDEGEWGMVAVLTGRGVTAEEAKQSLESIRFTWSHEDGDGHFLDAEAEFPSRERDNGNRAASIEVTMPRSLALRLVATTTNGPVEIKDVRTDGLSAGTTNGGVTVDADVTQVDLGTTNGAIDATLRPTGSGRIHAGTTNGKIDVRLVEDGQHGYDLDAGTTNGEVDVTLRDGEVGPCPEGSQYYTPPCNHRSFKTRGYESRAIRSQVQLGTTNGGIEVSPA